MKTVRNINQFKTTIDDKGRVCTKCGVYKLWADFFASSKTATKKQSECKECKNSGRRKTRDYDKEKHTKKKRLQTVKKENPVLYKARALRSRLFSRTKDKAIKDSTPSVQELYEWLSLGNFSCYYSGEELTLDTLTVDHKTPITRGGTNEMSNLCFCSSHMNTSKGTMTEEEFVSLLQLIESWEDGGKRLLRRLKQGYF